MTDQFEETAVNQMQSFVQTNLSTYLRAVESADGLAANSLTDPIDYQRASRPFDPRFPLVQIYDVKTTPAQAGHRNHIAKVEVELIISDVVAGSDVQGAEDKMRRYLRAIRNCVASDYNLGTGSTTPRVAQAVWIEAGRVLHEQFADVARVGRGIMFEVEVFAP